MRIPGSGLLLSLMDAAIPQVEGILSWVTRVNSKILESPDRMRILQIVFERPGTSLTDLASRLSMSWGQLNYHLNRLEDAKLVTTVRAGRHRLVFPIEEAPADTPEDRAIILEKTARALALIIVENPRLSITDLVELSGETPRVVYYHLKRLLDSGLVASASSIHYRGLVASPRLVDLLGTT